MNTFAKFKQIFLLSCIMFAIFFGAGNLVFPPMLGYESGNNFPKTIIGFLIMDVGLTTLSTVVLASIEGKAEIVTDKISKKFTFFYVSLIYILIGPAFIVPRTAVISYDLSVSPFLSNNNHYLLLIFSIVYFALTLVCCMYSSKSINFIGKYIIPILLLLIIAIIIGAILWPQGINLIPTTEYRKSPLIKGMLQGYLTMDAIGTIIVVNSIINRLKEMNITKSSEVIKSTTAAGILSGVALCILYAGLGYVGFTADPNIKWSSGANILIASVSHSFSTVGTFIIIIAILIACFTTTFTLIVGFAEYFNSIFPKFSYKKLVVLCTLFSFIVSNLGFNLLMKIATPVLNIIYPISIVVLFLTIFRNYVNEITSKVSILVSSIIAIIYNIYESSINLQNSLQFLNNIPLFEDGLGWLIPTIIISVITQIFTKLVLKK